MIVFLYKSLTRIILFRVVSTLEYIIESKLNSLNEDHRPLKSYFPCNCVKTVEQESYYEDIDCKMSMSKVRWEVELSQQMFGHAKILAILPSADGKKL